MAKEPKATPQNGRRILHSKTKIERNGRYAGLVNPRDNDSAPDVRYLEVIEEMLRERENNGRDRDEPTGAVKDMIQDLVISLEAR